MSEISNKFKVLSEISEEIKKTIIILHVFNNWFWNKKTKTWDNKGFNCLFITNEDKCYALGENSEGVLGLGHNNSVSRPTIIEELCDKEIVSFANGLAHCLARSATGKIYSFGHNTWGQIGVGFIDKLYYKPIILQNISEECVVEICCAAYHSVVLTKQGEIYIWGDNEFGQIGSNNNEPQLVPIKLEAFLNTKIIAISCGGRHSMVLTEKNQLFSWGQNKFGQLGTAIKLFYNSPQLVSIESLNKDSIQKIVCGYAHSLVLTSNGYIYVFGTNTRTKGKRAAKINLNIKFKDITSVSLFSNSFAISQEGVVYNWGRLKDGFAPLPKQTKFKSFTDIFVEDYNITYNTINFSEMTCLPILRLDKFKNEFTDNKFISRGGFGIVFQVVDMKDQNKYAVKQIPISEANNVRIKRELKIMSDLKSEYIVKYNQSWFEKNYYLNHISERESLNQPINSEYNRNNIYLLHIQMELCSTTLNELIELWNINKSNVKQYQLYYLKCEILTEILEGVDYLHKQNIIHRDLKPDNILITYGENGRFVKIGDFGLAVVHETTLQSHSEDIGARKYMAPEVLRTRKYDITADLYSLGVIIKNIFKLEFKMYTKSFDSVFQTKLKGLIQFKDKLKLIKPNMRPNCIEILNQKTVWALNLEEYVQIVNMDQISDNYSVYNLEDKFTDFSVYEIYRRLEKSKLYNKIESFSLKPFISTPVKETKQEQNNKTTINLFNSFNSFFNIKKKLDISEKVAQLLLKAGESERWLNETFNKLNSSDYGNDENTTFKLLVKHIPIEQELDINSNKIIEIIRESNDVFANYSYVKKNHLNEKFITIKKMKDLRMISNQRRNKLIKSLHLHQFLKESNQFFICISKQIQTSLLLSNVKDYEHFLKIQSCFFDIRSQVENRYLIYKEMEQNLIKMIEDENIKIQFLQLEDNWNLLLKSMETQKQKIRAAEVKHCFDKEVLKVVSTIQDMLSIINRDLDFGEKIQKVERQILNYQVFEMDLLELEANLKSFCDSARLKAANSEEIADHISKQLNIVDERFTALKNEFVIRKEKLEKRKTRFDISAYVTSLLFNVNQIEAKMKEIVKSLTISDYGEDYSTTSKLLSEQIIIELEIDSISDQISEMIRQSKEFFQKNRSVKRIPSNEKFIFNRMKDIKEELKNLELLAKHRKHKLIESKDLHEFMRESEQLLINVSEQIKIISSLEDVKNYDHLSICQDKFSTIKKQVDDIELRYTKIKASAQNITKLVKNPNIEERTSQLEDNWNLLLDTIKLQEKKLKIAGEIQQSQKRKTQLNIPQFRRKFLSKAAEVESLMNEKIKILKGDNGKGDNMTLNSLNDKIANDLDILTKMKVQSNELFQKNISSKIIASNQKILNEKMKEIDHKMNEIELQSKLTKSNDLNEFLRESDQLLNWISKKMQTDFSLDICENYAILAKIQAKFSNVKSEKFANENSYKHCKELAQKLIKTGVSDDVEKRLSELQNNWNLLLDSVETLEQDLKAAEINLFNKDINKAQSRLTEMSSIINSVEFGQNLHSGQISYSKYQHFENDLVALEAQLNVLFSTAGRLQVAYPEVNAHLILVNASIVVEHLKKDFTKRKMELQYERKLEHNNKFISVKVVPAKHNKRKAFEKEVYCEYNKFSKPQESLIKRIKKNCSELQLIKSTLDATISMR